MENAHSDTETTVVYGSSLMNIKQTTEYTDREGITLRRIQSLKMKKKSSPAKYQKKSDNLTVGDSKCHLGINSDQRENLCRTRSSNKRKCEFEEENVTTVEQIRDPKEEGFPDPKQGQTLGSHKQKIPKIAQSSQSCVQSINEIFSMESAKQQDITDLTDSENSSQNVPSLDSSSECKLGLANNSTDVADCQQNAVEMMVLDSSPSMRHQIENESDKQTLQKVPILVDLEPSADTIKHTGDVVLINSEADHCNSGSKSCELSLLSEESGHFLSEEISMPINTCNSNRSLTESSCQLSELDAMDARVKASGSPCHNKSPTLQQNSPLSLPKSPRYSPYSPALADRLDISSSPLLPKKTDSNDVGVQREEVPPLPSIKGILKSPSISCPTACNQREEVPPPPSIKGILKSPSISCPAACNQREEVPPPPSIKGILKSPSISCPTACKCDICFSTQLRSKKAREFSQRQMSDINALTCNLLKQLNTMRTIAEEYRTFETALSSPSSKFTVEEINQAIAKAFKAEKTTKKWINMMSRDCNRFSAIMRSSDKRTSLSSDPQKQQRKIKFADEAGKELCHVKIFEKDDFFEKQNNKDKDKEDKDDQLSDGHVEGNS